MNLDIEMAKTIVECTVRECPSCASLNRVDHVNITPEGLHVGYFICRRCKNEYDSIILKVMAINSK